MNMLLTARQLDRLRELPPGHKLLTARDGSPILERPDGRLWRVQPNGNLAQAPPVERVRLPCASASSPRCRRVAARDGPSGGGHPAPHSTPTPNIHRWSA